MDVKESHEKILSVFEQFKQANDARIAEVEKKGHADPLLVAKVDKANAEIGRLEAERVKLEALVRELETKSARIQAAGAGTELDPAVVEHRKAFGAWMRKGVDAGLAELQEKAMSLTAGEGGYTVPQEMSGRIGVMERTAAPMLAEVETIPVSSDNYEEPIEDGESASGWVGDTDARTETTAPTFVQFKPSMGEVYANPKVSQRMLDDARWNIEAWLATRYGEKFGRDIDTAIVSGNGTTKPKGILAYTLAATGDASRAYGTIERLHSGTSGDFTANNVISLAYLLRPGYRQGAKFAAAALTWAKIRQFKDATSGQYLWQPGLAGGQPATLLGYPVIEDENVPAVAASAYALLFGNFKRAYTLVEVGAPLGDASPCRAPLGGRMRAEVLRTLLVAWDGVTPERVEAGAVLEGERAAHAVEQGFARSIDAAPESKALPRAPRNKGKGEG
jgi:HK97 family phage major capsid protein